MRPDECWTIGVHAGATSPVSRSVSYRVGWESGLDIGYYWLGCRRGRLRFGLAVGGNVSQFYGAAKLVTRGDVLLGVRLNGRVGPLYLGARIAFALRITKDGRFPEDVDPKYGDRVTRYLNLGFNVGPELSWPITRWLSLYLNVDYLFSDRELGDDFPQPRGQPMHAFTARLGVLFRL